MPRKIDDRLISQIFDENASGDPGTEWLRDSLKELRDVPAHGLSNERLRDRLLATNLAPAKSASAPWWSWAWAPVAAAAFAVVIAPRLRPAEAPSLILKPDLVATNTAPNLGLRTAPTIVPDSRADLDALVRESELAILEGMEEAPVVSPAPAPRLVASNRPVFRRDRRPAPQVRTKLAATPEPSGQVAKSIGTPPPTAVAEDPAGAMLPTTVALAP